MMHITAKTFTSAAEQLAHRKAVRDRLFPPPPARVNKLAEVQAAVAERERIKAETKEARRQASIQRVREAMEAYKQSKMLREVITSPSDITTSIVIQMTQQVDIATGFPVRGQSVMRTVESIIRDVLRQYQNITLADIRHHDKVHATMRARHHVWYAVYLNRPDLSLYWMGHHFNRNHSTIIDGIRRHIKLNNLAPYVPRYDRGWLGDRTKGDK